MEFLRQSFSLEDIPRVFVLSFLEVILSADNAIVLAFVTSRLSPNLRNKALYIGFVSAWIFRLAGLLGIAYILAFPLIEVLGGGYLIYLAAHHFLRNKKKDPLVPKPTHSFWTTILLIEFFDLAFAVDSIVAGVAFIGTSVAGAAFHPKLWIVYIGGMIGVFVIRYAAHFFSAVMHRYPRLDKAAYWMIASIGIKLCLQGLHYTFPYYEIVFWAVLILLFAYGMTKKKAAHV